MLRFVGLVDNESQPGNEFAARPGTACRTIVRRHTRSRPRQLARNRIGRDLTRQSTDKPKRPDGKLLRAQGEFVGLGRHSGKKVQERCRRASAGYPSIQPNEDLKFGDLVAAAVEQILKSSNPQILRFSNSTDCP